MTFRVVFIAIACCYLAILQPFTAYMKARPVAVKLGYLPEARILKIAFPDYRNLLAQYAVVKVLFYYGTMAEQLENRVKVQPEYFNMFRMLQTAIKLDPYNMDAYYFAQAAFTWELGKIREVNDLLDFGMRYRTWDYQLPFYAGFNTAYFQKDYKVAAEYMRKAAELSADPLFTNLASRYFYEAGQTGLGFVFLDTMEKGVKNEKVKRLYGLRKEALSAVMTIEKGMAVYATRTGRRPSTLTELVNAGILSALPRDPYGGRFYIDGNGNVRSTSKFAFTDAGNQNAK